MMMLVDTNILVYAADADAAEHAKYRKFLLECRSNPEPWHLTWGIIYEFLRIMTHPQVLRRPWTLAGAWDFIMALNASPSLRILVETDRHPKVVAEILKIIPHRGGNIVFDAHAAALMKEHGVRRICSKDGDFRLFSFIEIVE